LSLIIQKYGGTSVGSLALIRAVAERVATVRRSGNDVAVVVSAMGDATDRLLDQARALCARPDVAELDALLATGEQVSIALLAMALIEMGIPARSFCGSQVRVATSGLHGRARIAKVETGPMRAELASGVVPVIAGFQGVMPDGRIATIGRGGSDTSAVAIAVALQADECQILTDVDGVYTTDPRVVPEARLLHHVTFEEMLELAGQGSRVLHLRSVEFARKYGMPLRVLPAHRRGSGTLISAEEPEVEAPVVSGIAFNRDEAQITVTGLPDRPGIAHGVLSPVSEAGIEVDMIVLNGSGQGRVEMSFTVHRDDFRTAIAQVQAFAGGFSAARVSGDDRVAKLAAVGVGMRSHAGVATKFFAALAAEGIGIRMVSTSEIKIAALVAETDLERGVAALHRAFGLEIDRTD